MFSLLLSRKIGSLLLKKQLFCYKRRFWPKFYLSSLKAQAGLGPDKLLSLEPSPDTGTAWCGCQFSDSPCKVFNCARAPNDQSIVHWAKSVPVNVSCCTSSPEICLQGQTVYAGNYPKWWVSFLEPDSIARFSHKRRCLFFSRCSLAILKLSLVSRANGSIVCSPVSCLAIVLLNQRDLN